MLVSTAMDNKHLVAEDRYEELSEPTPAREAPALRSSLTPGWAAVGVLALLFGGLSWYYFGSELRRYIKMERM